MTTAPSIISKSSSAFRLTQTDDALLQACARYQYLTVDQSCRFFGDESKRRYLQRRTRELAAQDYLIRLYLPRPARMGKGPSIFTHGLAGRRYVASLGLRVPRRFRRGDVLSLSPQHLAHSEDLTDLLLSFDLLARHDERIQIPELLHERFLHEQRFKVPVRRVDTFTGAIDERQLEVIPDAFVRVVARVGSTCRSFPLIIEVDRDTEQQVVFREKIARLSAFGISQEYEQRYGARTFNVAFFVQAPRRDPRQRLAEIMTWTERELRQRQLGHEAVSFNFCALDPATTPPDDLLLGANWLHPFSATPHPLLDLTETPEGGV